MTMKEQLDFNEKVSNFKSKYQEMWWDTTTSFPQLKTRRGYKEKKAREKETDQLIYELSVKISDAPLKKDEYSNWSKQVIQTLRRFGKDTLGYQDELLDIILSKGYFNVTRDFIIEARRFEPEINVYDIFQAIRNVWIMNSIQLFLNQEISFSPSIFSYSMLYPYTDNYLDSPDYSKSTKLEFIHRFGKCLAGESVTPSNKYEKDIFRLIGLVEQQYPRKDFPNVYCSMLAIHKAQEKSLQQQRGVTFPYEKDILGISFEKGGTSVLADGYLVNGDLRSEEADFMFGYGVFLQLADDLQDIEEDYQNGHTTIFSHIARKWPLDEITNRLFWFIETVIDSPVCFSTPGLSQLKKLIKTSCHFLILEAVAKNRKLYSRSYIKEMEAHSLYRFSYQKKARKKLMKIFSAFDQEDLIKAFHTLDLNEIPGLT
jgi:hypothetical protein